MTPPLKHPTALVGYPPQHREHRARYTGDMAGYVIEDNTKIEAFCLIECGIWQPTWVAKGTWLMPYVHIGHDAVIGTNCEIAGGSVIAAHSRIGNNVKIGLHTTTKPGVSIGTGARTGAGAVVVCDIPPGETWVGNPARPIRRKPAPEPAADDGSYDEWERIAATVGISASDWRAERERQERLMRGLPPDA